MPGLTGDKAWLDGVWPKLERAVGFIRQVAQAGLGRPQGAALSA